MNKIKEPKFLKIFRGVGFSLILIGITLIVLGCIINTIIIVPGIVALFFSAPCLFIGFSAKINKMGVESVKYVQEINKDDLKDIANTSADIVSEPIAKVAKSIKKAVSETKFCKHCGAEVDNDSKFCKHCGKEQWNK